MFYNNKLNLAVTARRQKTTPLSRCVSLTTVKERPAHLREGPVVDVSRPGGGLALKDARHHGAGAPHGGHGVVHQPTLQPTPLLELQTVALRTRRKRNRTLLSFQVLFLSLFSGCPTIPAETKSREGAASRSRAAWMAACRFFANGNFSGPNDVQKIRRVD